MGERTASRELERERNDRPTGRPGLLAVIAIRRHRRTASALRKAAAREGRRGVGGIIFIRYAELATLGCYSRRRCCQYCCVLLQDAMLRPVNSVATNDRRTNDLAKLYYERKGSQATKQRQYCLLLSATNPAGSDDDEVRATQNGRSDDTERNNCTSGSNRSIDEAADPKLDISGRGFAVVQSLTRKKNDETPACDGNGELCSFDAAPRGEADVTTLF